MTSTLPFVEHPDSGLPRPVPCRLQVSGTLTTSTFVSDVGPHGLPVLREVDAAINARDHEELD